VPELLTIENLKVSLRDASGSRTGEVLKGIDLHLAKGDRVALVGESGCGKSVTALSILKLLPNPPMAITDGTIQFNGKTLNDLTEAQWREVRGKEIGIVFQEPLTSLNPVLLVGDQLEETLCLHLHLSRDDAHRKAVELLREVGLAEPERIVQQYPHQLSGGMCQRVMIAMAMACGPSLLIADEPTTALDVTVQAQILELLFQMTRQHGLSVLFITHDLRIVRGHADRVVILYAGEVVEEGTPSRIFEHAQHPYTEGLLDSLPEFSHRGKPLRSIAGAVPSPFTVTVGCAFSDRCPKVQSRCRNEKPGLTEITKGHRARCFYPSGT
jgi:peptide/nickel transport system ATP-binding protein